VAPSQRAVAGNEDEFGVGEAFGRGDVDGVEAAQGELFGEVARSAKAAVTGTVALAAVTASSVESGTGSRGTRHCSPTRT
jgi:hypothetical protein